MLIRLLTFKIIAEYGTQKIYKVPFSVLLP